jgi:hypothetical protein
MMSVTAATRLRHKRHSFRHLDHPANDRVQTSEEQENPSGAFLHQDTFAGHARTMGRNQFPLIVECIRSYFGAVAFHNNAVFLYDALELRISQFEVVEQKSVRTRGEIRRRIRTEFSLCYLLPAARQVMGFVCEAMQARCRSGRDQCGRSKQQSCQELKFHERNPFRIVGAPR